MASINMKKQNTKLEDKSSTINVSLIKKILVALLIVLASLLFSNNSYAKNLDEITDYEVKVTPNKKYGSLDIEYTIKWKVLDSTTEGPLTWVQIGTPNEYFSNVEKKSSNIRSISRYNNYAVRIDFNEKYKAGDEFTFSYKIHQTNLYTIKGDQVEFEFWPAWFDSIEVKYLAIFWEGQGVSSANNTAKEGEYLMWSAENLPNGGKLKTKITYPVSYFTNIDLTKSGQGTMNKKQNTTTDGFGSSIQNFGFILLVFIVLVIVFISILSSNSGYYGHRGFYGSRSSYRSYGGYSSHHSSCVHSSCACASCACACACAGSGRAGCSLKDFYGTNLTSKKLKKAFNK